MVIFSQLISRRIAQHGLILLLCTLFAASANAAATIEVTLDRNPVTLNESFQLTFSASESPDDDPDFEPLTRQFEIVDQQKSSRSSWVNGKSSHTLQWTLVLIARQSGQLTIPPIHFGDDQSQLLQVQVNKASASSAASQQDELFLQISATPNQVYVQAQVIVSVRFYRRIAITQAGMAELEVSNAVVEKLGEDRSFEQHINGVRYAVAERRYALFPQQSGSLEIAPLTLTAQVPNRQQQSRFNSFFNNSSTQTLRIRSEAITLEVLPIPGDFSGSHWLSAEQLQLQQSWSDSSLTVKVGEPITRTVTINASGVMASQLPELNLDPNNANLKIYPDQPNLSDSKSQQNIDATRQQKIAYIPSTAGEFRLPAIELPWYDRATKTLQIARLPAVTLTAVGVATAAVPPAAPTVTPVIETPATLPAPSETARHWRLIALALGVGWLITLLCWAWYHHRKKQPPIITDDSQQSLRQAIKAVQRACDANDPKAARTALIAWAVITGLADNLDDLGTSSGAALGQQIKQLNQHLYGHSTETWQGAPLREALAAEQYEQITPKDTTSALQPLHPTFRKTDQP